MVGLSYGATSLFTTCIVLEIWWLKLQLKSCSETGVPVLRPPELAFTGQAVSLSWCPICQVEGDHTYDCPRYVATQAATTSRPLDQQAPRRQLPSLIDPPPAKRPPPAHCILYNKNAGACPYGSTCRFQHICSHCFNPHPVTSCTNKAIRCA